MTGRPGADVMEAVGPELLAMLDQLGFGVAVGDERRRFVFVSRRWCEMVGYDRDELHAMRDYRVLISSGDVDRVDSLIRARAGGMAPPARHHATLVRADGSRVEVEGGMRPVESAAGRLLLFAMRDVSAERERERQVEMAAEERRALLERLISVSDSERREIADGLHEDTIQRLAASCVMLESLRRHPGSADLGARLSEVEQEIRRTVRSLRGLIFELSPPSLGGDGLGPHLRRVTDHLFADSEVEVVVDVDVPDDIDPHAAVAAYRIGSEALLNAHRHSRARRVDVEVRQVGGRLMGEVVDDGIGPEGVAERPGHLGLRTMRDRAEAFGGELTVGRSASGGTRIAWAMTARRGVAGPGGTRVPYGDWRPVRAVPRVGSGPESFDRVIDLLSDIVGCFDRALRHVYVNPAVTAATGLPAEEFLGRTHRELGMPPDLAEQWEGAIVEAFRTGVPQRARFVYPTPTGARTYDAVVTPERSRPDGPVPRVWVVTRDVTDYVAGATADG